MLLRSVLLVLLSLTCGCRSPLASRTIDAGRIYESPELYDGELQIQRGQRLPIIDAIGWVIGIPDKLILWDRRVENHNVGFETEAAVAAYLEANQLHSVRVRINQYRPGEDWQRLVKNSSVGAPWRYTVGALSVIGETIIPGRIFGGDHYNPFTNTVHLYSDVAAIGLHEAGHSKDFARRKYKGTYAVAYLLPLVPLYHESVASSDVIAYLEGNGNLDERVEAARILYPAYGTYAGSAAGVIFPAYGDPLYLGGVLLGHAAGRNEARRIRGQLASLSSRSEHTENTIR